jgi:two-component system, NarL family, response regulator
VSTSAIRLVVVDDHPLIREGLRALLSAHPDLVFAGEAADELNALRTIEACRPDVVVMDLRLGAGSGLSALRVLQASGSRSRMVVYTSYHDEEHVYAAIAAGARGFVLKENDPCEILAAIRAVHAGRRYIVGDASARLAEHVRSCELTCRETDVLNLLTQGARNKEIASALGIALHTVKGHVRNLLSKFDASTRTEAVRKAIDRGLISGN